MTNSCGCLLSLLQPPQCEFPACNCEKCQQLRSEVSDDRDKCAKEQEKMNIDENACLKYLPDDAAAPTSLEGQDVTPAALFSRLNYNFQPENIYSVLFDVIGTIAFIVMATFTFWIVVCIYISRFVSTIYNAGRKPQVITIVLLSLLTMSIIFHAISDHRMKRLQKENAAKCSIEPTIPVVNVPSSSESLKKLDNCESNASIKGSCKQKCPHKSSSSLTSISSSECNLKTQYSKTNQQNSQPRENGGSNTGKDCGQLKKQASESLCDLCAKKFKKSSSKTFISDEEARQIYNKYQLCAIPMEWKSPPTPIVFIVDYIKNLFSSASATSAMDA